jgi:hypothetical protein
MSKVWSRNGPRTLFAAVVGVVLPFSLLTAQPPDKGPEKLPPPTPVPVAGPRVAILLKDRHGHATPERTSHTHTAGGNTDVAQAKDDTVVVTMTGVAVAGPHPCQASFAAMTFDFHQCFEVVFNDEKVKKAKLTMEAQIIGLLRGDKHGGSASVSNGAAAVALGGVSILAVAIEGHSVGGDENLSINDRKGPCSAPVVAGEYTYFQGFRITAGHTRGLCGKAASAEFAPDPALDPLWISYWEPFHGAAKKDFGFRVTLHVEPADNGQ